MNQKTEIIEAEPAEEVTAIERRVPTAPVTLAELAALKGEAVEIVQARIVVLETLRKAAIRATHPEDWLLFKARDGSVVGYLQDAGVQRIRDLYGIEIYDVSEPQKIPGSEPGIFHYIISGSGRCKLTGQVIENVEGGRSSSDDFCAGKTGAALELDVRKAARANLDGNIGRELAGLKSVPAQELETAWTGTHKKVGNCRLGRGFGSLAERAGAKVQQAPDAVEEPTCELCGSKMRFIKAGQTREGKPYPAFWSCPNGGPGKKHEKSTITHDDWLKALEARRAEPEPGSEG